MFGVGVTPSVCLRSVRKMKQMERLIQFIGSLEPNVQILLKV